MRWTQLSYSSRSSWYGRQSANGSTVTTPEPLGGRVRCALYVRLHSQPRPAGTDIWPAIWLMDPAMGCPATKPGDAPAGEVGGGVLPGAPAVAVSERWMPSNRASPRTMGEAGPRESVPRIDSR